jgi:hypothetical protein
MKTRGMGPCCSGGKERGGQWWQLTRGLPNVSFGPAQTDMGYITIE